jgi:hypothetical protein
LAEALHSSREAAELLADAIRLVGESADLCFEARALRHQSRFVSRKLSNLKRRNNDVLTISRFRRHYADRMLQRCLDPLRLLSAGRDRGSRESY